MSDKTADVTLMLEDLLEHSALSLEQIAVATQIPYGTLQRWRRGSTRFPRDEAHEALALFWSYHAQVHR
jgi:hypothetical protein